MFQIQDTKKEEIIQVVSKLTGRPMLDYLLEEACEDETLSVWAREWLMREYEELVIRPNMRSCWAIDELEAGVSADVIIENLWEGYEKWCDERLENERREYYAMADQEGNYE